MAPAGGAQQFAHLLGLMLDLGARAAVQHGEQVVGPADAPCRCALRTVCPRGGLGILGAARRCLRQVARAAVDETYGEAFETTFERLFRPLLDDLASFDHFRVTADFDSYATAQRQAAALYADPAAWWPKAALNTARMGWFSSDRTIKDYAREVWEVPLGGRLAR